MMGCSRQEKISDRAQWRQPKYTMLQHILLTKAQLNQIDETLKSRYFTHMISTNYIIVEAKGKERTWVSLLPLVFRETTTDDHFFLLYYVCKLYDVLQQAAGLIKFLNFYRHFRYCTTVILVPHIQYCIHMMCCVCVFICYIQYTVSTVYVLINTVDQ